MTSSTIPLLAPVAALLAALIAGSISFIALLVSKENKVSEFRQEWINALRLDFADYVSSLGLLTYAEAQWVATDEVDDTHWHDYLKTMQPTFQMYSSSMMRIRLRINRNDTDTELRKLNLELLNQIDKLESLTDHRNYAEAYDSASKLHLLSGPILKKEWNRVKQGEPIYRTAKWAAGIMASVSFTLIILAGIMSISQFLPPAAVTPNPSVEARPNGGTPGPGGSGAYHLPPGPGAPPSAPPHLKR